MSLLFLFVDGFGIGPDDPESNPVAGRPAPGLAALLDGGRAVAGGLPPESGRLIARGVDAGLGVPGKPRSGTGHVTILTGENAAALIGRHEGPYPGAELRALLQTGRTLPKLARDTGCRVAFANAFTPIFHDRLARSKARWSGFGLTCHLAGLTIRGAAELAAGRAVSSWPTNRTWAELGYPAPAITAIEAGRNLARLTLDYDLTFYEYFACDFAGHRGDRDLMVQSLDDLDQVVAGAWPMLAGNGGSIVIVSDHGNVEDWTAKGHTLAPALFVAAGPIAGHCRDVASLTDVAPAVLRFLGAPGYGIDTRFADC